MSKTPDVFLLESLKIMKHQKNIRNPYKRMLYQNLSEIDMMEEKGLPKKYTFLLRRIIKPITIIETLFLPVLVLITTLIKLRLLKWATLTLYKMHEVKINE